MGFIRANMIPILKESKRQPFTGHVLFLGHPDIYFDYPHLLRMAKIAGVSLDMSVPINPSPKPDFAAKQYLAGVTVFKMLGFEQISVLDYSDFEGANIVFDLNLVELPVELMGKFDVVIDHGTLEHVFHLPNALSNVHRLLKTGGRAITSSPSTNFFDHGFYMFQPTLFVDYYAANNWVVESIQVVQFTHNQETEPCFFADYEPGLFDSVGYGKMDNKLYSTVCVATKTIDSTSAKIPQQGYYMRLASWSGVNASKPSQEDIKSMPFIEALSPPFQHVAGNCYACTLPPVCGQGDAVDDNFRSQLFLLEDGIPLAERHVQHSHIQNQGNGKYSHWGNTLYFSTSDNTDPNFNGRTYEIRRCQQA